MMYRFTLLICAFVIILQAQDQTPNSDPNYRATRTAAPQSSFLVENIELKRDAGTVTLKKGTITFLAPVLDRVFAAVFSGEGHFQLKSASALELPYLMRLTGK